MSSTIRPNDVRQHVAQDSSKTKEVRMSDRVLQRLGAASGIVYVVLGIVAGSIKEGGQAPTTPVHAFAQAAANHTISTIGSSLTLLAGLCFLCFLGYLYGVLRRAEGDPGWLAAAAFGGGVMSLSIVLASGAPIFAAIHRANEGLDPQIARTLQDMNDASFFLSFFPLAVLLGAAAIVVIRYGALPRWLGWMAAVLAVALLGGAVVGAFYWVENAGLPFMLFLLWTLATSVVLVRRVGQPGSAVSSAPGSFPPVAS